MGSLRGVLRSVLVASALAGCFEEGGDEHQRLAAIKAAEGFIAFQDVSNNVTADPIDGAAAGEALTKFVGTPIAASALLSPPFTFNGETQAVPRIAPASPLPGCLTTLGEGGCDSFTTTTDGCAAGDFTFIGSGSRMCAGCPDMPDVFGLCTYTWDLQVGFNLGDVSVDFSRTTGTQDVQANQISGFSRFRYDLKGGGGVNYGNGDIQVCACGPLSLDQGPPKRLVSGEFVVRDLLEGLLEGRPSLFPTRCARVTFVNDVPETVTDDCDCSNGTTCELEPN
jgi:hypothetical protein